MAEGLSMPRLELRGRCSPQHAEVFTGFRHYPFLRARKLANPRCASGWFGFSRIVLSSSDRAPSKSAIAMKFVQEPLDPQSSRACARDESRARRPSGNPGID